MGVFQIGKQAGLFFYHIKKSTSNKQPPCNTAHRVVEAFWESQKICNTLILLPVSQLVKIYHVQAMPYLYVLQFHLKNNFVWFDYMYV